MLMLLIRLFAVLILSTLEQITFFWNTPTLKKHQVVRDLKKFEKHCFSAMMIDEAYNKEFCANLGHWDSQSPWHIGYADLFAGSHLLNAQKPESECYIINRFIGMFAE